jgi:hypothetical protein
MGWKRRTSFPLRLAVTAAALLAVLALASPHEAQAYDWILVTVDAEADVTSSTSLAVDANGNPMISYQDATNDDLKFAICAISESANGNCDQTADWNTLTLDGEADVASSTSLAVDATGAPMISYFDTGADGLKFATCDRSESANGNCDQAADWRTLALDSEVST